MKKKLILLTSTTLVSGSVLAACGDVSTTNIENESDDLVSASELKDEHVVAELTEEQIESCDNWQYDEENSVFECNDEKSEYHGQYYFNGFLFGALTGVLLSNAFNSGKKTNYYVPSSYTSKQSGMKYSGGERYSTYRGNTNNPLSKPISQPSLNKGNSSSSTNTQPSTNSNTNSSSNNSTINNNNNNNNNSSSSNNVKNNSSNGSKGSSFGSSSSSSGSKGFGGGSGGGGRGGGGGGS